VRTRCCDGDVSCACEHVWSPERDEAARTCADLLVRIVRPWYSGPSGDQGLNDPLYGECLRAIDRYKATRTPDNAN